MIILNDRVGLRVSSRISCMCCGVRVCDIVWETLMSQTVWQYKLVCTQEIFNLFAKEMGSKDGISQVRHTVYQHTNTSHCLLSTLHNTSRPHLILPNFRHLFHLRASCLNLRLYWFYIHNWWSLHITQMFGWGLVEFALCQVPNLFHFI